MVDWLQYDSWLPYSVTCIHFHASPGAHPVCEGLNTINESYSQMDDLNYSALTYQKIGYCAVIDIVTRPDSKDAAAQLTAELDELCGQIGWDKEVRVVILTFDGAMIKQSSADLDLNGEITRPSLVEPVAKLKQPVVAAIRGNAIELGLELALACDIRIATEGAFFGLPQINKGLIPSDGGTQRLPRLIGKGKAMEMILTGELIDAGEALQTGLINRVIVSDRLLDAARQMAQDMASKAPLSLHYAKESIYSGIDLTLDQGLRMESDLYLLLFTTRDRTEGITAFKEKRKPRFEGA